MAKNIVKEILMYKVYNGIEYFQVLWEDGYKSWIRLSNLACKDMVCDFIRRCLRIMRDKRKAEQDLIQKEREASLLEKIINKNAETASNLDKQTSKINIVNNIIEKSKTSTITVHNSIQDRCLPFLEYKHPSSLSKQEIQTVPEIKSSISRPLASKESNAFSNSHKEVLAPLRIFESRKDKNVFRIILEDSKYMDYNLFCKNEKAAVIFKLEDAVIADKTHVSAYLYSLYISQSSSLQFFLSDSILPSEDCISLENDFRSKKQFLIFSTQEISWVLYYPAKGDDLLNLGLPIKAMIFRVQNSNYLNDLFMFKNVQRPNTLWVSKDYQVGPCYLTDFLFAGKKIHSNVPTMIVCNERSFDGKHLQRFVRNNAKLVKTINEKSNVIVQDSYFDYIHQVEEFSGALKTNINFIGFENFNFVEILKSGGVITFTEAFLNSCDLQDVYNILQAVQKKSNWTIKISLPSYGAIKRRLNDLEGDTANLHRSKLIYKTFKENLLLLEVSNFREELEKKYWRDFKYVLTVDETHLSDNIVTAQEAIKIVNNLL